MTESIRPETVPNSATWSPAAGLWCEDTDTSLRRWSSDGRTIDEWIDALPEQHRPSVRAFDALVTGGRFPKLEQHFDVSRSYGADGTENGLDARYVGLSEGAFGVSAA